MSTVFIWGASGGIGRALVNTFAGEGWAVHGAARNMGAMPEGVSERYTFEAGKAGSYKEIALLLAQDAVELDLVIYAAGGMHTAKLEDLGAASWGQVLDANLNGAYLGVQSLLHLVPKGGHVMVIGAYVNKITLPKFGAYTTAKAALEPMMTIFQKENRRKNFTLVRPPAVDTAFWEQVPFNLPDGALAPEQVARAILDHYKAGESGTLDL